MRFRVSIRSQLSTLVAITSWISLMVLAVSTWIEANHYLQQVRSETLSVTANARASEIAAIVELYRDLAQAISTRNNIQKLLNSFNNGNATDGLRMDLQKELQSALAGGIQDALLVQAAIYLRADQVGSNHDAITETTGEAAMGTISLPYKYGNGSQVFLGSPGLGYPQALYPNLTWAQDSNGSVHASYDDRQLNYDSTLVLGPLYLDDRSALMSFTVAINNSTSKTDVLGYLTAVVNARLLYSSVSNPAGLGKSGIILIVGPPGAPNLFSPDVESQLAIRKANIPVWYVFPADDSAAKGHRHDLRATNPYLTFPLDDYPAAVDAFSEPVAGSTLSTHNEEDQPVSVGYAKVASNIVDWVVIFEESCGEALAPTRRLRNTILACVLGVFAFVTIISFPLAHYAVKPINSLRTATQNSIMMYEAELPDGSSGSQSDPESLKLAEYLTLNGLVSEKRGRMKTPKMQRRREFQIPERVPERKHLIEDELTELTSTFNEMSDELKVQYARLEDRVKHRTSELEKSRDLARAADESKTLFIANISHELRTPLNGIIGMCSVAMQEEEVSRIRQSINIIYKSSDLLLHLLNDLLTFSRNSYGQQLPIEQGVFKLGDIGTQVVSIFEKQAREKDISLKVIFQGVFSDINQQFDDAPEDAIYVGKMLKRVKTNILARGPGDTGPLREMALVGDKNRILQILMNLVSNSLKFTPANGMVEVRIRCKGFVAATDLDYNEIDSTSTAVASSEISEKRPATPQAPRHLKFDFEVEDTGPGIPEHLRQEIFKPFVQGDLALSRKHGGTGLGLAICAQLAALMGGGINLTRSTVDIGSTFTCSIPLRYTTENVSSVAGSLAPQSRRGSQRPPSGTSSIDVLSIKSSRTQPRGNRTNPPLARVSICSAHDDPSQQLDSPTIVNFSHPFPTEGEGRATEEPKSLPPRLGEISARTMRSRLESIESQDANAEAPADSANAQAGLLLSHDAKQVENIIATKSSVQQQPEHPPTPRILVAEDNKVNQEVIMRMLKLEKITDVALAEDGLQAVEHVRNEPGFSLILMDIQMPNLDGIEATKEIRAMGFESPIVALTAFDHERNQSACTTAGMDDFMGKPLKRKALKEVLEKYGMKDTSSGGGKDALKQMHTR